MAAASDASDFQLNQVYSGNCFPARTRFRSSHLDSDAGAWLVEQKVEERRIKELVHTKLRTYEQIRELRIQAEKNGTSIDVATASTDKDEEDLVLDGFFLLKCCTAQDPSDLCIANICGQGLTEAKADDFSLFDNVTIIKASENLLPLEPFSYFPELQKLEITVNGIRGIQLTTNNFPCLQDLDISYNNLSESDVLLLGLLPKLSILNISGNNLTALPEDMSHPAMVENVKRFASLEKLIADDNKLTETRVFTAVAGLQRLQLLSLANNGIAEIPHLLLIDGKYMIVEDSKKQPSATRQQSRKRHKQTSNEMIEKFPNGEIYSKILPVSNGLIKSIQDDDFSDFQLKEHKFQITEFRNETESLDEFTKRNLSSFQSSNEKCGSFSTMLPVPFLNLVCVNLAFNKITEEKSLLSIASWPKVAKLIIYNNPLTIKSRGELPVLQKLLVDRLGILVERKKIKQDIKKPEIIMMDTSRKIKTRMPVIPRCKLDDLSLMLEDSKRPKTSIASICSSAKSSPLPPIHRMGNRIKMNSRNLSEHDSTLNEIKSEFKEGHFTDNGNNTFAENSHNPIFMTEMINDIPIGKSNEAERDFDQEFSVAEEKKIYCKLKSEEELTGELKEFHNKYGGFEELLTLDETGPDDFIPPSHDINGNVRALRHILNHPLIFGSTKVTRSHIQKPYKLAAKKNDFISFPRKTRNDKTVEVLENLKLKSTVTDAALTDVFSKKSCQEFSVAQKLLTKVQCYYDGEQAAFVVHRLGNSMNERIDRPLLDMHDTVGSD